MAQTHKYTRFPSVPWHLVGWKEQHRACRNLCHLSGRLLFWNKWI